LPIVLPRIQLGIESPPFLEQVEDGIGAGAAAASISRTDRQMVAPPSRSRRLSAGKVVVSSESAMIRLLASWIVVRPGGVLAHFVRPLIALNSHICYFGATSNAC